MTVVVFRVDERLVHGQVVVGWGRAYGVERIVVVDDELPGEPLEQEIYRTGIPEGVEIDFWAVSTAVDRIPRLMESDERALVLTEDLGTMWRLAVEGVPIGAVNVGGIHAAPGRRRILPYVCLAPEDERRIHDLEAAGVEVTARDVPSAPKIRLVEAGV